SNQAYIGTGDQVIADDVDPEPTIEAGLGTLYRYSTATNKYYANGLPNRFFAASQNATNMHRIADGIVHFKVRPLDTNGSPLFWTNNYLSFWATNYSFRRPWVSITNTFGSNDVASSQIRYWFYSN